MDNSKNKGQNILFVRAHLILIAEVYTLILSLQMRKPKHREIKKLAHCNTK